MRNLIQGSMDNISIYNHDKHLYRTLATIVESLKDDATIPGEIIQYIHLKDQRFSLEDRWNHPWSGCKDHVRFKLDLYGDRYIRTIEASSVKDILFNLHGVFKATSDNLLNIL